VVGSHSAPPASKSREELSALDAQPIYRYGSNLALGLLAPAGDGVERVGDDAQYKLLGNPKRKV
jgi:hypothetical protein